MPFSPGSSPLSPSAFPLPSALSPTRASPPPPTLPELPWEAQKRIIHHALSLPLAIAPRHQSEDEPWAGWDGLAGATARYRFTRRVVGRGEVRREARSLMRVSKAWRKEAESYLYLEPHLTPHSLFPFCAALIRGDKRWSDLNLHRHSTPGRWVQVLDLSTLYDGYFAPHATSVSRAVSDILPLVPNLRHLKLPSAGIPFDILDELRLAECAKGLRALEGVLVEYTVGSYGLDKHGRDPIVKLLRSLPELELLSLNGPGDVSPDRVVKWEDHPQTCTLALPRLHTLVLHGVKEGALLRALIDAELPDLRTLVMTSYHGLPRDLTDELQAVHGYKILGLTFAAPREWPHVRGIPGEDVLEWFPRLRHLGWILPGQFEQLGEILRPICQDRAREEREGTRAHHPLMSVTIPKWSATNYADLVSPPQAIINLPVLDGPHQIPRQQRQRQPDKFFYDLVDAKPPGLRVMSVDGYRWVRREMGHVARMTGDSGEMVRWGKALWDGVGIGLRDMEGRGMPTETIGGGAGGVSSGIGCKAKRRVSGGGTVLGGFAGLSMSPGGASGGAGLRRVISGDAESRRSAALDEDGG